jgi:hypothetical protein
MISPSLACRAAASSDKTRPTSSFTSSTFISVRIMAVNYEMRGVSNEARGRHWTLGLLTLNSCMISCSSFCSAATSSVSSATRLTSVAVLHNQPEMRSHAPVDVGDGLSESRSIPFRFFTASSIFLNSLVEGTMMSTG